MDALLSALSGLLVHLNPIDFQVHWHHDQIIGMAQVGLLLLLVGLAATSLTRIGFPDRSARILALVTILLGSFYLFSHGGNPFQIAASSCYIAGGIFRFVGGYTVAVGITVLTGIGRRSGYEKRADLLSPVVLGAAGIYGLLCFHGLHASAIGRGPQIWAVLSITAAWISFAGLYGLLRSRLGYRGDERTLLLVAAGALTLVIISFIGFPSTGISRTAYAGWFPAGLFLGLFRQLAMPSPRPATSHVAWSR